MKKFCLVFFLIGLTMLVSGTAITSIYADKGYSWDSFFSDEPENHRGREGASDVTTTMTEITVTGLTEDYTYSDGESYSHYYSSGDIKGIKVDSGAANIYIMSGDDLSVTAYDIKGKDFSEKLGSNGILDVKYDAGEMIVSDLIDGTPIINISIPADCALESLNVELSSGSAYISEIAPEKFKLELSAGIVNLTDVNVTGKSEIKVTAGEIYIYSSDLKNTGIDMSAGTIYSDSGTSMTGETEIELSAGNIALNLNGSEEDYTFDVKRTAGYLDINNSNSIPDTHGSNKMNIKITAGNCSIYFE